MVESIQNTNNTVLILAAGYGRRMGLFSRMVNKCLVPYDNKPLISHIFDKFQNANFVIACGNMSQQVKDYVSIVHNDKNITFVDIPNFDEEGTGPATTIRYCKEYLPEKFFWISCDTLFNFNYIDKLDHNWIGVYPVDSSVSQDYCWIKRNGNKVTETYNKKKSNVAVDAFIGLMYINDRRFLDTLDEKDSKDVYEGFDNIDLQAYTVESWLDMGTYDKWKVHNEQLPEVSFPKPDELFYSDNNKIVKFTTNAKLAELKFDRAMLNTKCMPNNILCKGNFLFYNRVTGDTLYNCLNLRSFEKFLNWAQDNLWIRSKSSSDTFSVANSFYRIKTTERLSKFRTKYPNWVECAYVNKEKVKSIDEYIENINFTWLATETKWSYIHGDLQFDNIIYDGEKFTCIDWRTEFGGDPYGDLYYDLAKMLGGLYLSYKLVKEDKFSFREIGTEAFVEIPSVEDYDIYEDILKSWVECKGLHWQKVKTLVPIIYLNMAPLHDAPFDKFLISLAQYLFSKL